MNKSKHPLYKTWCGMKRRCHNRKDVGYKNYGKRGIKVCEEWRESFDSFVSDVGDRPDGHSLGRIDNDGNYEPSNCEWQTPKQQMRNTRRSVYIMVKGEKKTLPELSEKYGVPYSRLVGRLVVKPHWPVEHALLVGKMPFCAGSVKFIRNYCEQYIAENNLSL